jgi:diguanylate cyclase (GGDEF)-like protein
MPIAIELLDAFAAGIYLLFGIVHLDLWLKRRDRPEHFWLVCAAAGALLVDLTGMALRGSSVTAGIFPTINLLGVAIVTVSLLQLVFSLGEGEPGRLTLAWYAAMGLLAIFGGLSGIEPVVPVFFLASMVLLVRAMVRALRAGRAGDRESRAIAAGLIVLLLSLMVDVLRELHVIAAPGGIPIIGFAGMFLISASALNGRYEREHRELIALRHDLEERVSERTHELEDANQRLAEASRTDALTGLPNRRGFLDVVDHELKRSARAGDPCSVVMLDLDHFKEINDRHGHAAGDAVLQAAASRLRGVLRAADVVARWGGEEFIALLPATAIEAAAAVAEKARRALAASPFEYDGVSETITASFGVATHVHGQSIDVTIAAADRALYRAKESGRNRVECVAE